MVVVWGHAPVQDFHGPTLPFLSRLHGSVPRRRRPRRLLRRISIWSRTTTLNQIWVGHPTISGYVAVMAAGGFRAPFHRVRRMRVRCRSRRRVSENFGHSPSPRWIGRLEGLPICRQDELDLGPRRRRAGLHRPGSSLSATTSPRDGRDRALYMRSRMSSARGMTRFGRSAMISTPISVIAAPTIMRRSSRSPSSNTPSATVKTGDISISGAIILAS